MGFNDVFQIFSFCKKRELHRQYFFAGDGPVLDTLSEAILQNVDI